MKSFVITIMDEVCVKNGKDEAMQANLLTKLQEYGTVEPYDAHIAKHDAKWQKAVDEIKAEHDRVKAVACENEFELSAVKSIRAGVANAVAGVEAEKEKYRNELARNKEKLEVLKTNISACLGE